VSDTIVRASTIWTLSPERPRVEAVGIRDGRIVALGAASDVRAALSGPRAFDLGNAVVVPGLVDAHGHLLLLGRRLREVDLSGTRSSAEIAQRVAERARTEPAGRWIRGRGWDQNLFDGGLFPDRAALDRIVPGHAVYLERVDGHAALVNQRALTIAGLDRGASDPQGGRILRDPAGEPTGVLVDTAMEAVQRRLPAFTRLEVESMLADAAKKCASVGLVGVHDAGTDRDVFEAMERLVADGRMPLRVYAMARWGEPRFAETLERGPVAGDRLSMRAVKYFLDGALGSRGAALCEDYADEPGNRGLLTFKGDLADALTTAMGRGFQVACHAIGDRANLWALDAIEQAQQRTARGDLRPRIEHAQVLREADLPRFARSGVIASMQPAHAQSDAGWAHARLGSERLAFAYAFKRLRDAGARLAFGSDFPIEDPSPLAGLQAARLHGGMSREEALAAFTRGAAFAAFEEAQAGALEMGMRADLTAFDRDVLDETCAPGEARTVLTLIAGEPTFAL
jgi:predicted amidohydrolase YtcJ